MGGASTQITFLPDVDVLANKFPVTVWGHHYALYSHSYLNYGQNTAIQWMQTHLLEQNPGQIVIENPCMLRGGSLHHSDGEIYLCVTSPYHSEEAKLSHALRNINRRHFLSITKGFN